MCGISGMFSSPDDSVVNQMVKILAHRGPDGSGVWSDEVISLGHNRLSIVDIHGSQQPIIGNSSTVLIANGEIYNHLDLRREYLSGHTFKSNSDAETLVELIEKYGVKKTLPMLNGMFSFVCFNKYKNRRYPKNALGERGFRNFIYRESKSQRNAENKEYQ